LVEPVLLLGPENNKNKQGFLQNMTAFIWQPSFTIKLHQTKITKFPLSAVILKCGLPFCTFKITVDCPKITPNLKIESFVQKYSHKLASPKNCGIGRL